MDKVKENDIIDKLRTVIDPEMEVDIYDLGLIYGINIDEKNNILLDMTLTAKGCPISSVIKFEVEEALKSVPGVNGIGINLVWEPQWNPSMIKSDTLM